MNNNLQDMIMSVIRHKWLIVITAISAMLIAWVLLLGSSSSYEAKGSLLFKFGREYVYRPETGDRRPVKGVDIENAINTETQILNSRDVKLAALERIGLQHIYPDLVSSDDSFESAVKNLADGLTVDHIPETNVVHVYFRHSDPEIAASTLKTILNSFFDKRLEIFGESNLPFLTQKRDEAKLKLQNSENKLQSYNQKHNIYSIEDQMQSLNEQKTDLISLVNQSEHRVSELRQRIVSLQTQLNSIPENIPLYSDTQNNKVIDNAKAKLLELQLQEQTLLGTFREDSRTVQQVRQEIKGIRKILNSTTESHTGTVRVGQNELFQQIKLDILRSKAELTSSEAKLKSVDPAIQNIDNQLRDLDQHARTINELKRDILSQEQSYQTYVDQVEEARVADELDNLKQTNVRLIQEVSVPSRALGLSKKKKIAFAGALGVLGGFILAFLTDLFQGVVNSSGQLQNRTGLPVLASVSKKAA